jgi:hypothetical protein
VVGVEVEEEEEERRRRRRPEGAWQAKWEP